MSFIYLTQRQSAIFCLKKTLRSNRGAKSKGSRVCWSSKAHQRPGRRSPIFTLESFWVLFTFGSSSPFLYRQLITSPPDHKTENIRFCSRRRLLYARVSAWGRTQRSRIWISWHLGMRCKGWKYVKIPFWCTITAKSKEGEVEKKSVWFHSG